MPSRKRIAILSGIPVEAILAGANGRGAGHACTWLPQLAMEFERYTDEFDIHWITLDRAVQKPKREHLRNQTFCRLPAFHPRVDRLFHHRLSHARLSRAISRFDPSLVHVWGVENPYSTVFSSFKGWKVLSVQGCLSAFNKASPLPGYQKQFLRRERWAVRAAHRVTCESGWSAEKVSQLAAISKPQVIDYGVHLRFYDVPWTPKPDKPILLFSGALEHRKGFDLLIDAMGKIASRNWQLKVLGEGPLKNRFEGGTPKGIELLGNLTWDSMIEHFSSAWAIVCPTRADTGPTVVKEARVVGLPVVASIHGGLRDYIHHDVNGLVVEPLDAASLANALERIMGDFDLALRLGRGSHAEDRERFRPSLTAGSFVDLYRSVLFGEQPYSK